MDRPSQSEFVLASALATLKCAFQKFMSIAPIISNTLAFLSHKAFICNVNVNISLLL